MFRKWVDFCLRRAIFSAAVLWAATLPANAASTLDTIFVLDGSGSITNAGFQDELAFAENIVKNVLPSNSNAGAFEFGSSVTHVYPLMPLSGNGANKLSTDIAGIPYVGSATSDLTALQEAISLFTSGSPAGDARLIIWVTDDGVADPPATQNPCSLAPTAKADGITTVVVEGRPLGDATPALSCLASGSDLILSTFADFSDLTLNISTIVTQEVNSLKVPEPSGLTLLAVPLVALAASARVRARRAMCPVQRPIWRLI